MEILHCNNNNNEKKSPEAVNKSILYNIGLIVNSGLFDISILFFPLLPGFNIEFHIFFLCFSSLNFNQRLVWWLFASGLNWNSDLNSIPIYTHTQTIIAIIGVFDDGSTVW